MGGQAARPRKPNSGIGVERSFAAGSGKLEKRGGHDSADRVATYVLLPGVAAAVSKESRHGVHRAEFEPATEHVTGCVRATATMSTIVPQHCHLRVRCCRPTPDSRHRRGLAKRPPIIPKFDSVIVAPRNSSSGRLTERGAANCALVPREWTAGRTWIAQKSEADKPHKWRLETAAYEDDPRRNCDQIVGRCPLLLHTLPNIPAPPLYQRRHAGTIR
jgi:hypothetical protein